MQAVILAGGRGERLRPLTNRLPKPMVPVNKRPFLEYQINLLKQGGISRLLLLTGYLSEQISRYFGQGEKHGLRIEYSVEKKPLGTGGAIKNAEDLLEERFLLLNGDTYLKVDFQNLISQFEKSQAMGILCIVQDKLNNASGNIEVNQDFLLTRYKKDAPAGELKYVDAGCAIFDKSLIAYLPAGYPVSLENEAFPILIKERMLKGHLLKQRFYDIGSLSALAELKGAIK